MEEKHNAEKLVECASHKINAFQFDTMTPNERKNNSKNGKIYLYNKAETKFEKHKHILKTACSLHTPQYNIGVGRFFLFRMIFQHYYKTILVGR